MNNSRKIIYLLNILALFLFISACGNLTSSNEDITGSLDPVENVIPITGAENSTLTVNLQSSAYFQLEFQDIQNNENISNGFVGEGWCIDWQVPIDSNNTSYSDVPLYSTFNVESWKSLNYLLNIKDDLFDADPELTYREIQLVVWTLRGYPEFNLNEIAVSNLPSRMLENGEPIFSYEKVNTILQIVEEGYENFEPAEGTKYAVIAETPSDVQTVITVVEK
jgi:hypothetical protein